MRDHLMTRVHNELQNVLFEHLRGLYGDAVIMEEDYVDILVKIPSGRLLVEVKPYRSPIYCIREALGQLLYYASLSDEPTARIQLLVAGPEIAKADDIKYLEYVRDKLNMSIAYCTPNTYDPSLWRNEG